MHQIRTSALACAVLLLCAGTIQAELRILKDDGSPAQPGWYTAVLNPKTGGWDIELTSLYARGGETVYEIHGNAGEVIDNLIIDVPCLENGQGDCSPSGSPVFVRVISDAPLGIRSIHNIEQPGTNRETFLLRVDVTQDIGSVQADIITDLWAGRDIIGPVYATTPDHNTRGIAHAVAGRHVLGDIIAPEGRVTQVQATNGDIGTSENPVRIEARHNVNFVWGQDIYAHINARLGDSDGTFRTMVADRFFGTLEAETMAVAEQGGTPGIIYVTSELAGTMVFGKSLFDEGHQFELPHSGLTGQIIINADNEPGSEWSVPVFLGQEGDPTRITLTGPTYAQTADLLGGGSVGLAPFRLHAQSSTPASESTIEVEPGEPSPEVSLSFYGPITWTAEFPVLVWRRPASSSDSFVTVPSSWFSMGPVIGDARSLLLRAAPGQVGFESGYEYRVTPTTSLQCAMVSGEPPVVDFAYTLTVGSSAEPTCPADLDGNGFVNATDLAVMLGSWGPCGEPCLGDLTGNGVVNAADLAILLGSWGRCDNP